jgi:hypothetical protein
MLVNGDLKPRKLIAEREVKGNNNDKVGVDHSIKSASPVTLTAPFGLVKEEGIAFLLSDIPQFVRIMKR